MDHYQGTRQENVHQERRQRPHHTPEQGNDTLELLATSPRAPDGIAIARLRVLTHPKAALSGFPDGIGIARLPVLTHRKAALSGFPDGIGIARLPVLTHRKAALSGSPDDVAATSCLTTRVFPPRHGTCLQGVGYE